MGFLLLGVGATLAPLAAGSGGVTATPTPTPTPTAIPTPTALQGLGAVVFMNGFSQGAMPVTFVLYATEQLHMSSAAVGGQG